MKRSLKFFLILCVVAGCIFVSHKVLLPLFFELKEPYFATPLNPERKVCGTEGLAIRNDDYGDGYFGAKRRGGRKHTGIDLEAKEGEPVYASKSGWAETFWLPRGYGHLVKVYHPGKWQTRYAHLDKVSIKKSQWVWQGGLLGYAGKTGNADTDGIKPHLHFEIRYMDKALDPAPFLSGKKTGRPW